MRKILPFLLPLLLLGGCAKKAYDGEQDYITKRAAELQVDSSRGEWRQFADGTRWRLWRMRAVTRENRAGEEVLVGQAYLDQVAESNGKFVVAQSIPFDKETDAEDYVKSKEQEGKPPTLTFSAYRTQRTAALNAVSGTWYGNTEDGYKYGWQLPNNTYVLDAVGVDARGGADFDPQASKTFNSQNELIAAAGPLTPNLADYLAKRQQELGNAQIDWGLKHRAWQIYGFLLPGGKYQVDVVQSEPDLFQGYLPVKRIQFDTLDAAAEWASKQFSDIQVNWTSALQYSRGGWALIGFVVLIIFFVLYNISRARSGGTGSIRRIAGLDQIDEAVGRATEIARPVLMVPGLGALNGITVQAITIFAYIIRTAARFGTPIRLLNADASVYAVAQQITRDVYMSEGVPEQYDPTSVRFVSDRQFAFAAGVAGTIQRERVAATFFMGDFFAESMIFAENANMVGAIQVAATTQFTQTPFFIAACDYVLLGDEFYAASAYLGRQPVLIGSLIGVDWAKMMIMATIVLAVVVHSIQVVRPYPMEKLPPETRAIWEKANQRYLDWRKTELFFNRLAKLKRS